MFVSASAKSAIHTTATIGRTVCGRNADIMSGVRATAATCKTCAKAAPSNSADSADVLFSMSPTRAVKAWAADAKAAKAAKAVAERHTAAKVERADATRADAKRTRAAMYAELDAMAAERAAARAKALDTPERQELAKMAEAAEARAELAKVATLAAKRAELAKASGPSASALRAKAVADMADTAAKAKAAKVAAKAAERTAKRAARAAELAEWRAEFDAIVLAESRAEAARIARLEAEAAKADRELGGHWAANIGGVGTALRPVGMRTAEAVAMAADSDMAEAAKALGVSAAELATMWQNEKTDMRQARAERTAAMFVDMRANVRTRAEILAYRSGRGYALGRRVLAELGRDVMAVVTAANAEAETVRIYSAERAAKLEATNVAEAVAKQWNAAKDMAEAEAAKDSKARAKAVATFKRAEAKTAEAVAMAARWNGKTADGIACLYVAEATAHTSAAELATMRAKVAARWDMARAERLKAAKGHAKADPTAERACANADRPNTMAAKLPMSAAERKAKSRAAKRAAEGKAPARAYNAAALQSRGRGRAKAACAEALAEANAKR